MNRMIRLAFAGLSLSLAALGVALPAVARADTMVSRTYPWSSDRLALDIPADVVFHPGPTWRMTITATARTLNHLVVKNGVIKAEPHGCFSLVPLCIGYGTELGGPIHVDLSGPALRHIQVDGAAKIRLDQVRQDRLALAIDGSASVRGTGTVNELSIVIDGAGNIHLGGMSEQRARVQIDGSGKVAIAPTDSVSVHIDGAGEVRLHSNPAHVSTHIDGAGEVTRVPPA